jgi:hypothetical protein
MNKIKLVFLFCFIGVSNINSLYAQNFSKEDLDKKIHANGELKLERNKYKKINKLNKEKLEKDSIAIDDLNKELKNLNSKYKTKGGTELEKKNIELDDYKSFNDNAKLQITELNKYLANKRDTTLKRLKNDSIVLADKKRSIDEESKIASANIREQKQKLEADNSKMLKCLTDSYNNEVSTLVNSSYNKNYLQLINDIESAKRELISLGIPAKDLNTPANYIKYCNGVENAIKCLNNQCSSNTNNTCLNQLNEILKTSLSSAQKTEINKYSGILNNYSFKSENVVKSVNGISSWFGPTRLSVDALNELNSIINSKDYIDYPYITDALEGLKRKVREINGANVDVLKCVN